MRAATGRQSSRHSNNTSSSASHAQSQRPASLPRPEGANTASSQSPAPRAQMGVFDPVRAIGGFFAKPFRRPASHKTRATTVSAARKVSGYMKS